jgi:hypothetical protein
MQTRASAFVDGTQGGRVHPLLGGLLGKHEVYDLKTQKKEFFEILALINFSTLSVPKKQGCQKLKSLIDDEVEAKIRDTVIRAMTLPPAGATEAAMTEERKAAIIDEVLADIEMQKKELLSKFVATLYPPTSWSQGTTEKIHCLAKRILIMRAH